MGKRTTPMAVETVAQSLFGHDQADRVIAVELPHSHTFMHLDTVMSMVDTSTFCCTRTSTTTYGAGQWRRDRPRPVSV